MARRQAPTDGRAGPRRTCVACRAEAARNALVRLVLSPTGEVHIDYAAKLPGRGAWLHPHADCVARLESRPALLRRHLGAAPATEGLGDALRRRVERALQDGLSMAAAAGAVVGGTQRLGQALRGGEVVALLGARDASDETLSQLRSLAGADVPFARIDLDRWELGSRIGRGQRAAVGVRRSPVTTYLVRQVDRLLSLG